MNYAAQIDPALLTQMAGGMPMPGAAGLPQMMPDHMNFAGAQNAAITPDLANKGDPNGKQAVNDNSEEESNSEGHNDGAGQQRTTKRRSKNDQEGRDFKCNLCAKTYLSYPALYTHMKQKHSRAEDGTTKPMPSSGRGRGRPRKNPYHRTNPQLDQYF